MPLPPQRMHTGHTSPVTMSVMDTHWPVLMTPWLPRQASSSSSSNAGGLSVLKTNFDVVMTNILSRNCPCP